MNSLKPSPEEQVKLIRSIQDYLLDRSDKSHPSHEVTFASISWSYDGKHHVYICPKKYYFKSGIYEELVFDMDEIDKPSVDAALKKVSDELGMEFKQPRWHLMPYGR